MWQIYTIVVVYQWRINTIYKVVYNFVYLYVCVNECDVGFTLFRVWCGRVLWSK